MPRVHMLSSESPILFLGQEETALCGAVVPNARAIWDFNLETGEMYGANTIHFCDHCLKLALTPVGKRRTTVYGIATGQLVHDSSRFNSDASGEF